MWSDVEPAGVDLRLSPFTRRRKVGWRTILAVMLTVALFSRAASGQDVAPEPVPVPTPWQAETQRAMDAAGVKAFWRNKSFTIVIPEGEYDFYKLRIPPRVSLIADPNTRRSVRLRYVGQGDATLIFMDGGDPQYSGGYGMRFSGFDILAQNPTAPRLCGVHVKNATNSEVDRIRFAHKGVDTFGIFVQGRESVTVEKSELRSSVPLTYMWGDNIVFRDMDLGAATTVEQRASMNELLPSTCVWIRGQIAHVSFDGSQSFQGGDHAIFGETNSPSTGQGLAVYNLRYEQSISRQDPLKYAIQLRCTNRAFENLVLVNCRWTTRLAGIQVAIPFKPDGSAPLYPLVPVVTKVGCYLPGN